MRVPSRECRRYDLDGDGVVTKAELHTMLCAAWVHFCEKVQLRKLSVREEENKFTRVHYFYQSIEY